MKYLAAGKRKMPSEYLHLAFFYLLDRVFDSLAILYRHWCVGRFILCSRKDGSSVE
jgi:hypothetical protein